MSYLCDRARSITWGIDGRPAVDSARRLAEQGHRSRALPRRGLRRRARPLGRNVSRGRRQAGAASGTRSSATRRRCARTSRTATSRSSARSRTTASSSRGRRRNRRVRGRPRGDRARAGSDPRRALGLARGGRGVRRRALPVRASSTSLDVDPPVRRHPRLGHRRAPAEDDRDVPRDGAAPRSGVLAAPGSPRPRVSTPTP